MGKVGNGRSSISRLAAIDWSLVAFVFALCGLTFAYGVATMALKIFPYQLFVDAKAAAQSLRLMEDENAGLGMLVNKVDDRVKPVPVVKTFDAAAGNELLLVTGGPAQDAKHCPKFGCLAWIVNRKGDVLYSWPLDLEKLFKNIKGFAGSTEVTNFYPVGLQLQNDGTLIVSFHARNVFPYTVGIAKIGRKGEILWEHLDNTHHWFTTNEKGEIFAPGQRGAAAKYLGGTSLEVRCKFPISDEGVRVYRKDGSVVKTLSAIDSLTQGGYPGLLYALRDDCDPIHLNSVDIVSPEIATKLAGANAGDFLVSMREPSAIAVLDQNDGHVKMLVSGRTAGQHSAHFLPDGSVVAFDNLGGRRSTGGTRIARINLLTGKVDTVFPTAASKALLPFFSVDGGHVSVSPDGKRLMVSSKDESRDFEIDIASGKPLWSMTHIQDVAPFQPNGDKAKPLAGFFKAYGTYYVSPQQAQALGLKN